MKTKVLTAKDVNRRICLWSNDEDKFNLLFKILDKNYQGKENYVNHGILRNKLVYTGISLSKFSATAVMFGLAHLLGYEVTQVKSQNELEA